MPRPLVVRLLSLITSAVLLTLPAVARAQSSVVTGVVADAKGATIPRAIVRLLDTQQREVRSTLTDDAGKFRIDASGCSGCKVEASLSGFTPTSATAGSTEVKLVLNVAPIRESVIVTATRDEVPASQVGATTTAIDAAEMERRNLPYVSEYLRNVPGMTVVRTGGYGGVTSVFSRAGESNYNKVLLDGIPINEPGGTFDFSNLTPANLERIEIVRGAQSALFGSDAMSSVIQLVTKTGAGLADRRPAGAVNFEGGGYGTFRGGAEVRGTSGKLDYSLFGGGFTTDNRVQHNADNSGTFSWNLGGAIAPGWSARTLGRIDASKADTPGQTAFAPPDPDATFERHDSTAGVTVEQVRNQYKGRLTYARSSTNQESNNPASQIFVPAFGSDVGLFTNFNTTFHSQNVIRRHHLSYQGDIRFGGLGKFASTQIVTGLVDYDGERGTLYDLKAGTTVQATRNNVGIAMQYQAVSSYLSITAGIRAEDNDSFGTKAVPRVSVAGLVHRANGVVGDTKLKFNAGLGVKEPTILQSFSPNFFFEGNPDLLPERARTVDFGVEQRFAQDRAKVEAVWFDNRYRDQIGLTTINFTTFESRYENIGTTTAHGLEVSATTSPVPAFRIGGSYTFTDSEIVSSTNTFVTVLAAGNPAFRRPRHAGSLNAEWSHRQVSIDVTGTFIGQRTDSDLASLTIPINLNEGYALWALGGHYHPMPRVDVFVRIENLTDKDYMEPLGYLAWRRTAHAGVRVGF